MNDISAAHVVKILLYAYKQSHYTPTFFFFFSEILLAGDKKNPVRPLGRNFKKELPEHSLYFLEKKEKKRKNLPFRQ
jgi:hypothetical protein